MNLEMHCRNWTLLAGEKHPCVRGATEEQLKSEPRWGAFFTETVPRGTIISAIYPGELITGTENLYRCECNPMTNGVSSLDI